MDHPLRRLLIIAVLVSITFNSSAQNETPSEKDASRDVLPLGACIPGTDICHVPDPPNRRNPNLNKEPAADSPVEASGEEDVSKSEPSIICDPITKLCEGPSTRIICKPGTPNCNNQKPPDSRTSKLNEEAVAEEDTSKLETRTICNPITKLCQGPNPGKSDISDSPVEAYGEEDVSKSEPSILCDPNTEISKGPGTRTVCNPKTGKCQGPDPRKSDIADSPVEASGDEDVSKSEPSIICDPITEIDEGPGTRTVCDPKTKECRGQHLDPRKSDIADSPVEAYGEEDASKSEPSILCDPNTEICEGPGTRTVCNPITHICQGPDPRKSDIADSPVEASGDEDVSKSEPSKICDPITGICEGPDSRIVCNPITHICKEPHHNSFVSESAKVEQTEDDSVIHEEKERISPLVCNPHTGKCQDPHQNFGVAKPRDESA